MLARASALANAVISGASDVTSARFSARRFVRRTWSRCATAATISAFRCRSRSSELVLTLLSIAIRVFVVRIEQAFIESVLLFELVDCGIGLRKLGQKRLLKIVDVIDLIADLRVQVV